MNRLDAGPQPQILLPMLAGIGNAVMAVPLVRALGRAGGTGRVTVAARTQAIADVFAGLAEVARIEVLGGGYIRAWQEHRRIARNLRPDLYVVPFPSNRWQYSLLAAGSGARRVIMHDYPVGGLRALRFAPRMRRNVTLIPAERGIHDVVQNLRLLRALGGADAPPEVPVMHLSDADRAAAVAQLQPINRRTGDFIAIQPGGGDTLVGRAKRPPPAKLAELADALVERGRDVVIIEGPDERGVGRQVSDMARSHPPVIQLAGPLSTAAAILQQAALYVGTDSGLAHVAAAVGTPPVTLFAAADPVRVAPFGYEHLVVTPPAVNGRQWQPRLLYPMDHPAPKLRSAGGIDWAAHIRVEDILAAIDCARIAPCQRKEPGRAAGLIRG